MRDIGVFTSRTVPSEQLIEFVRRRCLTLKQPLEQRPGELVVGDLPDVLYVSDSTDARNGYFGADEKMAVESKLRSTPLGYLSIHFTSTDAAFELADSLAHELSRTWEGIVDYSGAGGGLDIPPR